MKYEKCNMIQNGMAQNCDMSQFKKQHVGYEMRKMVIKKLKNSAKNEYVQKTEFEIWIKYMNYKLFLEHAHSKEYYMQKQYFVTNDIAQHSSNKATTPSPLLRKKGFKGR